MADHLNSNLTDHVTSLAKAALGMVPIAGSFLVELAGTVIPRQRIDRLVDFAQGLEATLRRLDQDVLRSKLSDENFTDLLEEACIESTRAATKVRREYLANLVAAGVDEDRITYVESKHLLRILGQLNDIEVVWLRFYADPTIDGDKAFRERHAAVLAPITVTLDEVRQEIFDKNALQQNYAQRLLSLGLIEKRLLVDPRTRQPVLDLATQDWRRDQPTLTGLGRLLLRQIGLNEPEE